MCLTYKLWDLESRNVIDWFDSEQEALAAARAYLTPDDDGITLPVLLIVSENDRWSHSLWGDELARLAFGSAIGEPRRSTEP